MKRSNLLLILAAGTVLASCGGGESGPSKEAILKAAAEKTAIAIWADSGAPINRALKNKAEGAHAPILATSFTVKVDKKNYTTKIEWACNDDANWKRYTSDKEHVVVIPTRPEVGGENLVAKFTPTFSYEGTTLKGTDYEFYCEPYTVNPVNKTMAELSEGFFDKGSIKTGDVIRTKGVITFVSHDYSSIIIQDGDKAAQLYKSGAFSAFYEIGKTISVVGKVKDYNGIEFDPVLDVSPADALPAIVAQEPTKEYVEAVKDAWGNSHAEGCRWLGGELVVAEESKGKDKTITDRSKNTFDTLYLETGSETAKFALYNKNSYSGDDGFKAISTVFGSLKKGDKVKFKGVLNVYNGLVEANIYSDKDIEVTYRAPAEDTSAANS